MRFQRVFHRSSTGSPYPTLTDAAPTTYAYLSKQNETEGNVLSSKQINIQGFPAQRLCIGWSGPVGQASLPFTVYLWEETTGIWFQCGAPVTINNGLIGYVDIPASMDFNPTQSDMSRQGPGSLELAIVPVVASPSAGNYTFVATVDISSPAS